MKRLVFFITISCLAFSLVFTSCGDKEEDDDKKVVFVSKEPQYKKVLLEVFTGVKCGYCPDGHKRAQEAVDNNPGKVFVVMYHPQSSTLTSPHSGDPDISRPWPNDMYTTSFAGSTGLPGGFVNRNTSGGKIMQSRSAWDGLITTIMNSKDPSPANIGFKSSYDATTKEITVDVQIYFTADHYNASNFLLVLTEDDVKTKQSGSTDDPYYHKYVFREGFMDRLGEAIDSTSSGYLWERTYKFNNSLRNYDVTKSYLVGFIRDTKTQQIISVNRAKVGLTTPK